MPLALGSAAARAASKSGEENAGERRESVVLRCAQSCQTATSGPWQTVAAMLLASTPSVRVKYEIRDHDLSGWRAVRIKVMERRHHSLAIYPRDLSEALTEYRTDDGVRSLK